MGHGRDAAEQALREAREWAQAARERLRAAQAAGERGFAMGPSPAEHEAREALRQATAEARWCQARLWWMRLRGK